MIENVQVKDFMGEIEHPHNYRFISRNSSIYDAYSCFTDEIDKQGKNLDVLFITENGKATEAIMGLVTVEDVAGEV